MVWASEGEISTEKYPRLLKKIFPTFSRGGLEVKRKKFEYYAEEKIKTFRVFSAQKAHESDGYQSV